jgi:hypothetical protein
VSRTLLAVLGLALGVGPALAQDAPLLLHPVPQAVSAPEPVLVPPAVFGGPAFGLSGYGYYYDGPGEGPLVVPGRTRRSGPPRAMR